MSRPLSLIALSSLCVVASCKPRAFNARQQDASGQGPGFANLPPRLDMLDSNDVAFLLPLPRMSQMKSADYLRLSDVGVNDTLFKSVLAAQTVDDPATGEKIKSGIVMSGTRRPQRLALRNRGDFIQKPGPFDFDAGDRWRVVGIRWDPCGSNEEHNRLVDPGLDRPSAKDPRCVFQMRLVAQPILASKDDELFTPGTEESESGPLLPGLTAEDSMAGDYAIHLVYTLDSNKRKQLADSLIALKKACAGVNDRLPLGPSPCLRGQTARAGQGSPWQTLQALVKDHAVGGPQRIAFMGTELSQDPWVFYGGKVANGTFQILRTPPLMTAPSDTKFSPVTNKPIRMPFGNGYFQMMTFMLVRSDDTERGQSEPVVPLPNPLKIESGVPYGVRESVSELHKSAASFNIIRSAQEGEPRAWEDAAMRIRAIENPKLHDPLSTDCASCHGLGGLTMRFLNGFWDDAAKTGPLVTKFIEGNENTFRGHPDTTLGVMPSAYQRNPYQVLNFGYFRSVASVSERTANEAAHAAHLFNADFLEKKATEGECHQNTFRSCLVKSIPSGRMQSEALERDRVPESFSDALVGACMIQACQGRASKAVFEKAEKIQVFQATAATFLKNSTADAGTLEDREKCAIPKGTMVVLSKVEGNTAKGHASGRLMINLPELCPGFNVFQDRAFFWGPHFELKAKN